MQRGELGAQGWQLGADVDGGRNAAENTGNLVTRVVSQEGEVSLRAAAHRPPALLVGGPADPRGHEALPCKRRPRHGWKTPHSARVSPPSGRGTKTQGWSLGSRHCSECLSRGGRCPGASVHTPVFSLLRRTTTDKSGPLGASVSCPAGTPTAYGQLVSHVRVAQLTLPSVLTA